MRHAVSMPWRARLSRTSPELKPVTRAILIEFNELCPRLLDTWMAAGHLPNFKRLLRAVGGLRHRGGRDRADQSRALDPVVFRAYGAAVPRARRVSSDRRSARGSSGYLEHPARQRQACLELLEHECPRLLVSGLGVSAGPLVHDGEGTSGRARDVPALRRPSRAGVHQR